MSSYLMLFHFTSQGSENIREVPARIDAAKGLARELGGEVKQCYGLMGRYDTMLVLEAPNDQAAATIALAIGKQGNARTETYRAFPEAEFRQLVSTVPGKR